MGGMLRTAALRSVYTRQALFRFFCATAAMVPKPRNRSFSAAVSTAPPRAVFTALLQLIFTAFPFSTGALRAADACVAAQITTIKTGGVGVNSGTR